GRSAYGCAAKRLDRLLAGGAGRAAFGGQRPLQARVDLGRDVPALRGLPENLRQRLVDQVVRALDRAMNADADVVERSGAASILEERRRHIVAERLKLGINALAVSALRVVGVALKLRVDRAIRTHLIRRQFRRPEVAADKRTKARIVFGGTGAHRVNLAPGCPARRVNDVRQPRRRKLRHAGSGPNELADALGCLAESGNVGDCPSGSAGRASECAKRGAADLLDHAPADL